MVAADCVGRNLVDNHGVDAHPGCTAATSSSTARWPSPTASRRPATGSGIGPDELVVGAAGTADWRKGADLFVQVAALVARRAPDLPVRFVWVGRVLPHEGVGPPPRRRRGRPRRPASPSSARSPTRASYLALVDVFCLTSREDPFPLVCLEAGALGVPVVTFENGGMAELAVADGDDDPLLAAVPYMDAEAMADEVIALLRDPDGARRAGARLQRWVLDHHLSDVGAAEVGVVVDRLVSSLAPAGAAAAPPTG